MTNRNTSGSRRILIVLYGTLFMLCAALIGTAHWHELKSQREEALERLSAIAASLADQVPARHAVLLLEKYPAPGLIIKNTQDARYYVVHEQLRKAALRNAMEHPLLLVAKDERGQFVVVATSEEQPRFRAAHGSETGLQERYETGGRASEAGELLAVEPLRDEQTGAPTSVIVARMDESTAVSAAHAALWRNIAIAVALFGLAAIVLFRSVGRWVQATEADRIALASRNLDITDSIAYAGKIQRALVPPPSAYRDLFDGAFVIDRPKDLVSGDFHWCYRIGPDTCIVAAGDATGHGLPGAMMAAIGCSLLNEIVPANVDKDPAELLTLLNTRLVTTLHQQGQRRGGGDGMDIALCRIDRRQREILYAGAFRPLYWLHDGQLSVINGDRKPVGGAHLELERRFTCHKLAYHAGDRIYLFSDGYVDQFGGPERKRFMAARLHQLIEAHQHESLERQAELLEAAFLEWKGAEEQVDDVCLLGLAV
ncbi:MAG: serine/threonine-protein phosphatase [Flavobacteriales bacterium]|nr:serine/threonine-protein phosphatase [Flavobacteriales bacterium]